MCLVVDEDVIPSSPANWAAHCHALGLRYLVWLRRKALAASGYLSSSPLTKSATGH